MSVAKVGGILAGDAGGWESDGISPLARSRPMPRTDLTPEQRADADRIHAALEAAAQSDLRALAEQLATTTDRTIFGANEFVVRDLVLGIGAKAIETALAERKKGGTTGVPGPAPGAARRRSSSDGSRSGS